MAEEARGRAAACVRVGERGGAASEQNCGGESESSELHRCHVSDRQGDSPGVAVDRTASACLVSRLE